MTFPQTKSLQGIKHTAEKEQVKAVYESMM